MANKISFRVYVRIGNKGTRASVMDVDIAGGTTLDEVWNPEDDEAYRDIVMNCTASMPEAEQVAVDIPDPPPMSVTADAAA